MTPNQRNHLFPVPGASAGSHPVYSEALRLAEEIRRTLHSVSTDSHHSARLARALNDSLIDELASVMQGRRR